MTERGTLGLNELEPSKPFDRAGCIRHALSGFTPLPSLVPLGETRIGSRYFHSYSKYTMPGEQVIGHYDLDLAVAEKVRQFGSLEGEPTDAELQRLNEDETQTRKAFGSAIVTHARQFGLVKTLTPEQVKEQMLDHNLYKALDRIVNQHLSGFSYNEWEVLRSRDYGGGPILLVPFQSSEEGQVFIETVSLDNLDARDPEFLPQHILDYQIKTALSLLADRLIINLENHQVQETELLPGYIREVAKIKDPEQMARETQSILRYISHMESLSHEWYRFFNGFEYHLSNRMIATSSGRGIRISSYLSHMAECPTQTDETRQRNKLTLEFLNNLLPKKPDHLSKSPEEAARDKVLLKPYINFMVVENRNITDRELSNTVIDFIEKTRNIVGQEQFIAILQQELPEFYDTLVNFQEWLETNNLFGDHRFSSLISVVAKEISFPGERVDLVRLNSILEGRLSSAVIGTTRTFEGISKDPRGGVHITNSHLKALLPLMVIKAVHADAEGKKKDGFSEKYYAPQVQLAHKLTQDLEQSYVRQGEEASRMLAGIAEDKRDLETLQKQFGITDEEIAHLVELTKIEEAKHGDSFIPGSGHNYELYTALFNALVLQKQGLVADMRSPVFKEFLKSLFKIPSAIWDSL